MSLSAHKFHAPRGVGILYKKEGKMIKPLIDGGGQEKALRSSTENLPAIAATAKAMRLYLADEKKNAEQELAVKNKIVSNRKSTRLNSSHVSISYAVFCLKKKKIIYGSI